MYRAKSDGNKTIWCSSKHECYCSLCLACLKIGATHSLIRAKPTLSDFAVFVNVQACWIMWWHCRFVAHLFLKRSIHHRFHYLFRSVQLQCLFTVITKKNLQHLGQFADTLCNISCSLLFGIAGGKSGTGIWLSANSTKQFSVLRI